MKTVLLTVIVGVLVLFSVGAQTVRVLEQERSPLVINEFTAVYQEGGRYATEGIRYDVEFTNVSDQDVVAYAMGFFAFDVFNRSLGRPLEGFSVRTIRVRDKQDGAWVQRLSSPTLFRDYGTAVAYVARVRFADGTIWNYSADNVLTQLQEIEQSLTIEDLESQ